MEKHRAAAEWLESLSPDRSEDRAEMLAHHYREALRLAEASGADTSPFRAPAFAALAEASERAAALSSWAAAADLASEALTLGESPELALRLARGKAYGLNEFDFAVAESARDGFRDRGDLAGAAESESLLSWMAWWSSNGDEARAHNAQALELAAGLPTSVAKARAYAQAARLEGIAGEPAGAIELANEALALAQELDRDELQSNALNSRGVARSKLSDVGALDDLAQAIELADRSSDPTEMSIARNNYASVITGYGRLAEARVVLEEAEAIARRFGIPSAQQWAEMQRSIHRLYERGWDALLETVADIEARVVPDSQLASAMQFVRGWIHAARGETVDALRILEESLAGARRADSPQSIAPTISGMAMALHVAGRTADVESLVDEIFSTPRYTSNASFELILVLADLGRVAEWVETAELPAESTWRMGALDLAAGDYLAAADTFAATGAPFLEAWSRLIAAEHGDLAQLEPARAYFAAERAAPFLSRCEAVLAASA
jgi:hypothetical protein